MPPDDNAPGEPIPDAVSGPDALMQEAARRIEALEAELADAKDRWVRSEAEMANLRARTKREVEDARLYAVQKFARDIAEVADTLRRGLDTLPARTDAEPELLSKLRDGFEGVERAFLAALERNGVSRQDPTGAPFDPNLHQAMAEQETDEHPPGTVVQAYSQTWLLNGRLLRPAMVVVSKAASGASRPASVDTTV